MKILGISGSPHKNGNTAYSVQYALSILSEQGFRTKYISLAAKKINYCLGCFKCEGIHECCQKDYMSNILKHLRWCDALILGSPVYYGMVSGQLKIMMDRCVALRPNYGGPIELSGKIGGGIACGAFRNGGQEITLQNITTFFLQNNMRAISDGPSYSHSGAAIVGVATKDKLGLETVANLAANISKMLKE